LYAALDGTHSLKFYWIDLKAAAERSIQDPSVTDKLYHTFEKSLDAQGNRVFDRANSGLVFQTFQLLDPTCSPVLIIISSDASFRGDCTLHPLYCKCAKSKIKCFIVYSDVLVLCSILMYLELLKCAD